MAARVGGSVDMPGPGAARRLPAPARRWKDRTRTNNGWLVGGATDGDRSLMVVMDRGADADGCQRLLPPIQPIPINDPILEYLLPNLEGLPCPALVAG